MGCINILKIDKLRFASAIWPRINLFIGSTIRYSRKKMKKNSTRNRLLNLANVAMHASHSLHSRTVQIVLLLVFVALYFLNSSKFTIIILLSKLLNPVFKKLFLKRIEISKFLYLLHPIYSIVMGPFSIAFLLL